MRLGSQRCPVDSGTLASKIYGVDVNERHRHRYEVNNVYVPIFEQNGMRISARTPNEKLPEIMELPAHPFFIGVQFHPEFTSTPPAAIRCSGRSSRRRWAYRKAKTGAALQKVAA